MVKWWPAKAAVSALAERAGARFRRPRPLTRDEASDISRWVNEGGLPDPAGPPPVIDDDQAQRPD